MGQLLSLLGIFAVIFLVIGVAWLLAWKLGLLRQPAAGERSAGKAVYEDGWENVPAATPYAARKQLLSDAEGRFYAALRSALPIVTNAAGQKSEPWIVAKVRLFDVLEVDRAQLNGMSEQSARNQIIQRHADFVLCDPESTRPFLLIELDDKSHEGEKRKTADAFLNRACEAAGLPILRVKAAAGYSPQVIAKQIADTLRPGGR